MKRYRDVKLYDEDQQDLDEYMNEILERRKLEKAVELTTDDFSVEDAEVDSEPEPEIEEEEED
jgi:DNA-directed RNA polymerase subunit beta'